MKYPESVKGLALLDPVHRDTWRALQVDPHELDRQSPEQIRRTGQLPPTERLEWHTDSPLIVLGHGKPIDFPPPHAAKSAQIGDCASKSGTVSNGAQRGRT